MRRFLMLAAVAAAVGAVAAVTTTAFATAYGNLTFFAGGGGTASWVAVHSDAHSAVRLDLESSGYAGIELKHPSTTAPTVAPTFTTDNYSTGSPRLVIEFAGGAYLFGYPSQFSATANWEVHNCNSVGLAYTDYATALTTLQAGTQADNSSCAGDVTAVFVVADGSSGNFPETDNITGLTYDGTTYIG